MMRRSIVADFTTGAGPTSGPLCAGGFRGRLGRARLAHAGGRFGAHVRSVRLGALRLCAEQPRIDGVSGACVGPGLVAILYGAGDIR